MTKACPDCGQEKSLVDFPPQARRPDGRGLYCRSCMNQRHRAYREAKREAPRVRAYNAEAPAARTRKWCPRCAEDKDIGEFGRNRATSDGRTAYCKPCHNDTGRENRIKRDGSTRDYHLKRRYGLSSADVDAMVAAQGGVCALCGLRTPEHVDHDHVTGRVRGVLCSGCNQGLGNFRDDPSALALAVAYLQAGDGSASARRLEDLTLTRPSGSEPWRLLHLELADA